MLFAVSPNVLTRSSASPDSISSASDSSIRQLRRSSFLTRKSVTRADPFRWLAGAPARHGGPALGLVHADRDEGRDAVVIALSRHRPEAAGQLEPRRDRRDSVAVGAGLPAGEVDQGVGHGLAGALGAN